MSLIVGQNSWCTINEADIYLTDKQSSYEWFNLEDTDDPGKMCKTSLLVSAFRKLKNSAEFNLSSSLTDDNVKSAQIEMAWFLYKHGKEIEERQGAIASGLISFGMSKRRETLDKNCKGIPGYIADFLLDYAVGFNTTVELNGEYDV
jgi:hypothetical protein